MSLLVAGGHLTTLTGLAFQIRLGMAVEPGDAAELLPWKKGNRGTGLFANTSTQNYKHRDTEKRPLKLNPLAVRGP